MGSSHRPGEFEQLILLALLRLRGNAYGVSIRTEIQDRTGRDVSSGALYTTLDRMEKKGLIASRVGEPTPERGGRRKKFYTLTAAGESALGASYEAIRSMSEGIEAEVEALVRR